MKKSFFNENNSYTNEALQLDEDINESLHELFNVYINRGYSPREISHLLQLAVFTTELNFIMGINKAEEKQIEFTIGENSDEQIDKTQNIE